jgi:phospholipid/cholesterol/gamma-HCH transport system substrate-binding protein
MRLRWPVVAATAGLTLALSGCQYQGLNDFTLPGSQGSKPGSYEVKLEMANVGDLVPNNPVRLNDVNVGTIKSIRLDGWHALVTISINPDVVLPANVTARVGQASLLGAKFCELDRPAEGATGRLMPGATLGLAQTGKYTETEDILASVAMLLNGGGLAHLKTITAELNRALSGREPQFRGLLTQLNTFVTRLDKQKADIVRAINGIDRLSGNLAAEDRQIQSALTNLPPALKVLNDERQNMVNTLQSLSNFGGAAHDVINRGGGALAQNISDLGPSLKGLADAGQSLTNSLDMIGTALFPLKTFGDVIKGDFINFYMTLDLSLGTLDRSFLTGTPLAGQLGNIEKALAAGMGLAGQAVNPLTAPILPDGVPGVTGPGLEGGTDPVPPGQRGTEPTRPPGAPSRPSPTPHPSNTGGGGLLDGLLGGGGH